MFKSSFILFFITLVLLSCDSKENQLNSDNALIHLAGEYNGINPLNGKKSQIQILNDGTIICLNMPHRTDLHGNYSSSNFETAFQITDSSPSGVMSLVVDGYFIEIHKRRKGFILIHHYDVAYDRKIRWR